LSESSVEQENVPTARRRLFALLPLVVVLILGALFFFRLFAGDASRIPSALIGKSAPSIDLAGLGDAPGLADADLRKGHVSIINVFGSWCLPCHAEHETLMALAADKTLAAKGVALYGVAQRDEPENLRRFLGAKGDPYAKIGLDQNGRVSIDWGVYGVPETFIVKGDGTIAYKFIGPMDAQSLASVVRPEIDKAMN
jgi:cytochrome c biogenesis protein CcmG, thiol:disulfide interchange protein DsbE